MAVQESASNAAAAIKAALDDMLQQLRKHKGQLRSTHDWSRRRNGSQRVQAQVPFEQTFAAVLVPTISCEDVRSYVNANLGRLERFIERELFFAKPPVNCWRTRSAKKKSSMRRSRALSKREKSRNAWR